MNALRNLIYTGTSSFATSRPCPASNNDGAELTSYADDDDTPTKIPDGVLPGQTFAKTESGRPPSRCPRAPTGQTLQVTVPKPRVDTYTATVPKVKPGQGFYSH